jgi:hypothetical protein
MIETILAALLLLIGLGYWLLAYDTAAATQRISEMLRKSREP